MLQGSFSIPCGLYTYHFLSMHSFWVLPTGYSRGICSLKTKSSSLTSCPDLSVTSIAVTEEDLPKEFSLGQNDALVILVPHNHDGGYCIETVDKGVLLENGPERVQRLMNKSRYITPYVTQNFVVH